MRTPAARSPATPGKTRQVLILDGLVGRTVVLWARFGAALGSWLAPLGRHLGVGWADEGLDAAWLVGWHVLGDRLAEKGLKKAWRAQTVFTHISEGC